MSSFAGVAVTGVTPSLDVGSYSYFSGATFNANTTISFASVPTNARWTYSAIIDAMNVYYLEGAVYDNVSFLVSAQESQPSGMFFKPDGTEMYISGHSGDDVNQYTLGTAWDITTAVYTRKFSVSSQDTLPSGIFFKPDGTEMYVCGATGDDINQYTLTTGWNVSTASYTRNFSVSSQETGPTGVFFKPDGTEMYIVGTVGDDVNQYTLSTAWNISTASYTRNFSVSSQDTQPKGLFFSPDGTFMFVTGDAGNTVEKYTLSTGWNISTASHTVSFSIADEEAYVHDVFFKSDGTKMYITGNQDRVQQYSTAQYPTLTLPAACSSTPTLNLQKDKRLTLEFVTLNGGTNVDVIQASVF